MFIYESVPKEWRGRNIVEKKSFQSSVIATEKNNPFFTISAVLDLFEEGIDGICVF